MKSSAVEPRLTDVVAVENGAHHGRLWAWDLSPVAKRLEVDMGWSAPFVLQVEREYRRFIALVVMEPAYSLGMQGPVDEFWHRHILFTQDYHRFCHAVAGGYIHHSPRETGAPKHRGSYQQTLALLGRHFGKANEAVWPQVGAGVCDSCASCDKDDERTLLTG